MRVLVACEHSGAVRDAFARQGCDAWSCDLKPSDNGGKHIQGDALALLDERWDILIAHPPCTFLSGTSAQWMWHPDDVKLPQGKRRPHPLYPNRAKDREEAIAFFMAFANADVPHIAIENPVGYMSTIWQKPTQIVQPFMFGDEATKLTCLWLKGLPKLVPTDIVGRGERIEWIDTKTGRKRTQSKWYAEARNLPKAQRQAMRSRTFPGIANAMASQWTAYLNKKEF